MHSTRVKRIAYRLDPECWISYSGKPVEEKRAIEARRGAALKAAKLYCEMVDTIRRPDPYRELTIRIELPPLNPAHLAAVFSSPYGQTPMSSTPYHAPLKLRMLLHFHALMEPFAPEKTRTSQAYTTFVRELLRDGLIERPTEEQRKQFPGWAYRTTPKGRVFIDALTSTPLPVPVAPKWTMPER